MNDIEIKKALYKENPKAEILYIRNMEIHYVTKLNDGIKVYFMIPMEETKGADFLCEMDGKHLIRWYNGYSSMSGTSGSAGE